MEHKWSLALIAVVIIALLVFTPSLGAYYTKNMNKITGNSPKIYHSQDSECVLDIKESVIIIRLDDVRAYSVPSQEVIDLTLSKNIPIVLGVIPNKLTKDRHMSNYLRSLGKNPLVEMAQHGLYHNSTDINISEEKLLEGKEIIISTTNVVPVTYVPPFNQLNPDSFNYILNNFKILSSEEISNDANKDKYAQIIEIDKTVSTYNFQENREESNEYLLEICKKVLEEKKLCVLEFHPQEFSTVPSNAIDVNAEKLKTYGELLDSLKQLNVSFSTFKDLVECN